MSQEYRELLKKNLEKPANVGERVQVLLDDKWDDFILSGIWTLSPQNKYDFQVTLDKDGCDGFLVENILISQIIKITKH